MARLARVIAPGFPHHVTQRGNRRQTTFFAPDDYRALLEAGLPDEALDALRRHERTGRPLGSEVFVQTLVRLLGRNLTLLPPGRKPLKEK
jgi:hypothetical protein